MKAKVVKGKNGRIYLEIRILGQFEEPLTTIRQYLEPNESVVLAAELVEAADRCFKLIEFEFGMPEVNGSILTAKQLRKRWRD